MANGIPDCKPGRDWCAVTDWFLYQLASSYWECNSSLESVASTLAIVYSLVDTCPVHQQQQRSAWLPDLHINIKSLLHLLLCVSLHLHPRASLRPLVYHRLYCHTPLSQKFISHPFVCFQITCNGILEETSTCSRSGCHVSHCQERRPE